MKYIKNILLGMVVIVMIINTSCMNQKKPEKEPVLYDKEFKMWFNKPGSDNYFNCLPLGNGLIGAMVQGNPGNESININEGTIWTGSPNNNVKKDAYTEIEDLRADTLQGKNMDQQWVDALIDQSKGDGILNHGQIYQFAGKMNMQFKGHELYDTGSYRRELDLNNAVASVHYTCGNVEYDREHFINYPSNVMVTKLTASEKSKISLNLSFLCDLVGSETIQNTAISKDTLLFEGAVRNNEAEVKGVPSKIKFAVGIKVILEGGNITSKKGDPSIEIENADSVVILLCVNTNFISWDKIGGDAVALVKSNLNKAYKKGYSELKEEHLDDYRPKFGRVSISLGESDESVVNRPVDERLATFKKDNDPELVELYYQYNRYLLLSCSREGGQPANLQGIWNSLSSPPWDSKYTININTEMNYWGAYIANLGECAMPFEQKVLSLKEPGEYAAKELYGINEGWTVHHNTDLWNITGPLDGAHGITPTDAAWLSNQLYDDYLFTMDKQYLKEIYDTIKGAAEFLSEFLIPYTDKDGKEYLVTCPSTSPEMVSPNGYVTFASAFDNQQAHQLFHNVIEAAAILGKDEELINELKSKDEKLPPSVGIGRWGQVKEFYFFDKDDINNTHRHISHLVGVYPLTSVDISDPDIKNAVIKTLAARTKPGDWTGWG
ncbi:MAG: glycoside hydrolase family 95 protein, partial [Clostridiales bacterium]|nr:glycoside hydrolase family 95 protein [Clostridiales bacterium]